MRRIPATDLLLGAALALSVALAARVGPARAEAAPSRVSGAGAVPVVLATVGLQQRANRSFRRSPFRLGDGIDRTPEPAPPPAPTTPMPAVSVRAIVGGPPWSALLAGLPGVNAERVVREADRFGVITVRAIGVDWVLLQAPDTNWTIILPKRRQ